MARVTDTGARMERLEAALVRADTLPKGTILTAEPMRMLVGFSWVTVRKWCDSYPEIEGSGCVERGDNGVKYFFKPVQTIKKLLEIFRREAAEAVRRNLKLRKQIGVDLPEAEEASSLDDVRKLLGMTFDVIDRRERMKMQIPVEEFVDFGEKFCREVSDAIMGVEIEIDPVSQLPARERKLVSDALIAVAGRTHAKAEKTLEVYRARIQQAGIVAGGAAPSR